MMVNMVKAPFDVSLHEPFNPCKILLHILERSMTTPFGAEPVGCVQKSRLIDTLQYHMDDLLHQLIVEGRNTEGTLFAVGLGDICPAGRGRLVAEILQFCNQRIDTLHAHTVHGLAIRSSGHVALLGLYLLVCGQIKFGIVQIAVKSLILTSRFRQDLKVHTRVHRRPAGPLQPAPDQGHHRQGRYGPLHPGGAEVRLI